MVCWRTQGWLQSAKRTMRVEVDHQEIQEILGAFALHAVEDEEAFLVERHVEACEECRHELERHLDVASLLSTTERFAPAELWESIAGQIPRNQERSQVAPRSPDNNVVTLRQRFVKPLAAAAVLAIVGASAFQSIRLNTVSDQLAAERIRVAALTEQLDRPPLDAAVAQALARTESRLVTLGSQVSGSNAIIVLMPDGTGYLAEHTLQPLPDDRTYQLWAVIDGKIISAGILGSNPGVVPFRIDLQGFAGFAITEEAVGGVESSQNDPVIAWLEA